jgi:hypothetical protein
VIALPPPPEVKLDWSVLTKRGVSAALMFVLAPRVANTHEQARAARTWASITGVKRVILPEIFSAWRTRWLLAHALAKLGDEAREHAMPRQYTTGIWWRHDQDRIRLQRIRSQHDILKSFCGRHHYGLC